MKDFQDTIFDVVIVGLGPTGATLANVLGGYGLDVIVLEREAEIYPLPRAVHFDDEAMRVFQSIGLADRIAPKVRVNCGTRFVDRDQKLILDWPRPMEVGPLGWHPSYRFHQPDLEKDLNVGVDALDNVVVMRGVTVTAVVQDNDGVTVDFDQNGATQNLRGRFVVGCDGARSIVRDGFACEWEDLGFKERWLVVDVELTADRSDLGDFTIQTCDVDRPTTYVRCPENRRRWEISLLADETSEQVSTDAFIWTHLRPPIAPNEGRIERRAVYHFESKISEKWRDGRCFVAGDAAHLMPPFLGQGMCTGIRDAANIGWKLAAVLKWGAPDSLLDSYEGERRPHTRVYIETAVRVGQMMNSAETAESLTHAIRPDGAAQMNSISTGLGEGLGTPSGRCVGQRMPQPRLADGTWLSDAMAGRFVIVSRHAPADLCANEGRNKDAVMIIDASKQPDLIALLDEQGVDILIIRPDFYSYGGWKEGDGDIGGFLREFYLQTQTAINR